MNQKSEKQTKKDQIEKQLREELKQQDEGAGKVSASEAAAIQSADLPSGEPVVTSPHAPEHPDSLGDRARIGKEKAKAA